MNAIGYVRVSTEDQAVNGVSLAAQEERVRAYCIAKGWNLMAVVRDEGESAKSLDRPGLQSILGDQADKDFLDALVVLKLDRLTRNGADLHTILDWCKDNDVALVAVEESLDATTAAGRLMLNILTSVSQWEREAIGERTKTALRHLKAQGQRYSKVAPYGYQFMSDNRLMPNPTEQSVIRRVLVGVRRGWSLRTIVSDLAGFGITARNGREFHPQTLAQIIKREGK